MAQRFVIYVEVTCQPIMRLDNFFDTCRHYNLKLSAQNCKLYRKTLKCSERMIDAQGYRLDLMNIEAIRNMDSSSTAEELCHFIHGYWRMSNYIPDFHRILQPLSEILKKSYVSCRKAEKQHREKWHTTNLFRAPYTKHHF